MDAVESMYGDPTGEYFQLNSYENRVFDIRLEGGERVITKFYRPGRWSESQILEEHEFLTELRNTEVPVIAALPQKNGRTISQHHGMYMALFPKARGRMPQEFSLEDLQKMGRVLARLHNVGARRRAPHRLTLNTETFGYSPLDTLEPLISPHLQKRYIEAAEDILTYLDSEVEPSTFHRIHGDCHRGNVLMTDEPGRPSEFFLVDFDDFVSGPAVQDFWMLFRQDEDDFDEELDAFLSGYTELRDFDEHQLDWMEPLRGMRIIHYAAWIARRWEDPSFPQIFPQFATEAYWLEEAQALEKISNALRG